MQGVCQQRHFPAVAQPFKIFWAPWPLVVAGAITAFSISILSMLLVNTTVGSIALPVLLLVFHTLAVVFGLRMRYAYNILMAMENRKTGSTNLGHGGNVYGNI